MAKVFLRVGFFVLLGLPFVANAGYQLNCREKNQTEKSEFPRARLRINEDSKKAFLALRSSKKAEKKRDVVSYVIADNSSEMTYGGLAFYDSSNGSEVSLFEVEVGSQEFSSQDHNVPVQVTRIIGQADDDLDSYEEVVTAQYLCDKTKDDYDLSLADLTHAKVRVKMGDPVNSNDGLFDLSEHREVEILRRFKIKESELDEGWGKFFPGLQKRFIRGTNRVLREAMEKKYEIVISSHIFSPHPIGQIFEYPDGKKIPNGAEFNLKIVGLGLSKSESSGKKQLLLEVWKVHKK